MILLLLLINHFLIIFNVYGKEKLPRFVVEEFVKPAIFGSYSYNPLTQMFEKKDDPSSNGNVIQIQIYNRTITQTQVMTNPPAIRNTVHNIFRKHVTATKPKSPKKFHLRPILRTIQQESHNSTSSGNSQVSTDHQRSTV
ncbi:uncharacterized protein LOC110997365 [Pieris rapae]|uniref:uncharacterized protein LOC110997365 n=1 Tax=Pieris rapae TaxID=64459 RepID=UPI001E27E12D|nr:uncharacterized protein LOC110997365 [Pieris rapae]